MKKFMNLPFGDGFKQVEITDNHSWEIVEVHYDGENKKYRAVKFDDSRVIKVERLFLTREQAQEDIEKQ